MRQLLILIFCIVTVSPCEAQRVHSPDPKAKQINDKAVSTYIKYNKIHDSVISAIRMVDEALSIDSNYLIAWTNKLGFECRAKQYDNALNTVKRIINIFPRETDIAFFSGILELKTGHNDDAMITLNHVIRVYDNAPDPGEGSDHLNTAELNKGIALKLMGKTDESKQVLVNLSMKERDLAVRRHINAYITKSKEEIINEMIAGK